MPRPSRIEYAGAIYQMMSRGHRREPIFHDDRDSKRIVVSRQLFVERNPPMR